MSLCFPIKPKNDLWAYQAIPTFKLFNFPTLFQEWSL
jgi:hypothetical protein